MENKSLQLKFRDFATAVLFSIILTNIFVLIFVKFATNFFTQEEYGQFLLMKSFAVFLSIAFSLEINSSIVRYFVEYDVKQQRENISDLLTTGFASVFFLAIATGFMLFSANFIRISFFDSQDYVSLLIVSFLGLAIAIQLILTAIFSAQHNSFRFITIQTVPQFLSLVLAILISVAFRQGVLGALLGFLIAYLVIDGYFLLETLQRFGLGLFSFKKLKKLLSYSIPTLVSTLVVAFFLYFLYYSLSRESGTEELAIFGIAMTIGKIFDVLSYALRLSYLSTIIRFWEQQDIESLNLFIDAVVRVSLTMIVPFTLVLYGISPVLVEIISNSSYQRGVLILPYIIGAFILSTFAGLTCPGPVIKKKMKIPAEASVIAATGGFLIAVILISNLGLLGAAIAFLSFHFLRFLVYYPRSQRLFRIQVQWGKIVLIFLTFLAMVLLLQILQIVVLSHFTLSYLFAAILGFGIIILFRGTTFSEILEVIRPRNKTFL